jgi:23S rRNA (cytosine1962-C5)-methyltransferase
MLPSEKGRKGIGRPAPMNPRARVILKHGREASVARRHPWVFSGAVARIQGAADAGATAAVCSSDGRFMAWGQVSPASQIRVRLVSWREGDAPDSRDFWSARLDRAVRARGALLRDGRTNACRLVHGESDGVPGLVADRYGDWLVVQFLSAGAEARREMLLDILTGLTAAGGVYERSDADVREKEGLPSRCGLLSGREPPPEIEIAENGMRFLVDPRRGHKTGFYLDQRENRLRLRALAGDAAAGGERPEVLNAFSYTGAFAVSALAGGAARVVNVDSSREALEGGRRNVALNSFPPEAAEDIEGNAFDVLRSLREDGRRFDIVVLDPPKFAFSQADVPAASRGYKDLNFQAMHLLRPGGALLTFSCSGAVDAALFQKIVFAAALDSKRSARIVGVLAQGEDHPVDLTFPEAAYLKGLVCRVW